jgi:hypothetical protein
VAQVQRAAARRAGLELGGHALAVAALEERAHQRRPHAEALRLGVDAEEWQVPVQLHDAIPRTRSSV